MSDEETNAGWPLSHPVLFTGDDDARFSPPSRWSGTSRMARHPKANPILTAEQLAKRWSVTTDWIYAKTRAGQLPKIPLPGRYYRYRLDAIEAFERGESVAS